MVAQQQHPGVEGTGHGRGQRSGAGDEVEAEGAVVGDRDPGGGDALAAENPYGAVGRGDERRELPGGPVEVRLDDVQDETGGDGRVEGVAAVLQYGHGAAGGEPVRGGHHAEGALEGGSGREHAL